MEGVVTHYFKRKHGIPPDNRRAWLTLRVQHWIYRIIREKRNSRALRDQDSYAESKLQAVSLILKILLMPRTERHNPGLAKGHLTSSYAPIVHKRMTLNERLAYGAAHCLPYERMTALLFIGLIFEFFSTREKLLLCKMVEDEEFDMPRDLFEMGRLILNSVDEPSRKDVCYLLCRVHRGVIFSSDLMSGFFSDSDIFLFLESRDF